MFPVVKGTTKSPSPVSMIKIKSPKSDIKVHKLYFNETSKITPELPKRGNNSSIHNEDKITQAWNKLKINALSKAIAIVPEVGPCTIGPKSFSALISDFDKSDAVDIDKVDLSEAVTSTPFKPKNLNVKPKMKAKLGTLAEKNDSNTFDDSESPPAEDHSCDEYKEIEALRKLCLSKVEAQVERCVQKKTSDILRAWQEYDEKTKEKLLAYKIELDKELLLRIQEQNIEARKVMMESKANAQLKVRELEQSKSDHEKKIAETSERIKLIEQQRKELEEKQKQKREELKQCINNIYKIQVAYGQKYNQINEITKKCRDTRALNERVMGELSELKRMNEQILKLVDKSKEGKVTLIDLKTAETLLQQITTVGEVFARHTDEINEALRISEEAKKRQQQEIELKTKQEAERQQKAQEAERQKKAQEEKERTNKEQPKNKRHENLKLALDVEDCVDADCLRWHLEKSLMLDDCEKTLQPLLNNDSLKQFRFDCQKVVNVPVNAISPLDDLHLEDKLYKLTRMLKGEAVPCAGNTLFLPTGHPLGVLYCMNLLAKKFVKQGEHVVSSKPEAAFAIAAVIVALWVNFPQFGDLLLAHFHRECPYLIPIFIPQVEGQSNEDYYKMLGYQYTDDGKVESQDKFLRRMSGIMRLYAAILVTPLKRSHVAEGKKHPLSMQEGWRWLAATLNLSPRPDISPTLLFDFLEVAGWLFYKTYGSQFTKMLQTLCTDYFPLIEQVTPDGCGGPVVRLKSFLEKILKERAVPPPTGLLPHNFW
uniref:mRNA export factor GLE1 n=1 Tax=Cuerna arida TaxID=1464854 RepID=A0A1B6FDP1_9HEMI